MNFNPADDSDDSDFTYDTQTQADQGLALAGGAEHPDRAWILTDRDCWYANPHYTGAPLPHPEVYEPEVHGEYDTYIRAFQENARLQAAGIVEVDFSVSTLPYVPSESDCPF